jgi:hypothetical protein
VLSFGPRLGSRPVVHRHEATLGCITAFQRKSIAFPLEVKADKRRGERLATIVDCRLLATTVVHAGFEVGADPRACGASAGVSAVAAWAFAWNRTCPVMTTTPVSVPEIYGLHRTGAIVFIVGL